MPYVPASVKHNWDAQRTSKTVSCCASVLEDIVNVSSLSINYLLLTLYKHHFGYHHCTWSIKCDFE